MNTNQSPAEGDARTPHAFACRKTIESGRSCESWCGNQHSCISTLTYKQTLLQEAYERGHRDALWAVENELARESRSTSPHRRLMAEQLFHTFSKIKPKAFDFAPTAEADSDVQPKGIAAGHKLAPLEPTPQMRKAAADAWLDCDSKLFLNKAAAALRAGIAAAPTEES